jgi:hypothetical protein
MKILGILVIYDNKRSSIAELVFKRLLENCSELHTLCVVSNNPTLCTGDVQGSNTAAEFSAWDEGALKHNLDDYDILLLANDTFCTRREFAETDISRFSQLLATAEKNKHYIIGEISWGISYKRMISGKKFLLRWVRTSVFAVSTATFRAVRGAGISPCLLEHLIKIDSRIGLKYAEEVPPLMKDRINAWLFPEDIKEGWYKAHLASPNLLHLKAKSIFQELDLSVRCEKSGSTFIPLNRSNKLRTALFYFLYCLQHILPD